VGNQALQRAPHQYTAGHFLDPGPSSAQPCDASLGMGLEVAGGPNAEPRGEIPLRIRNVRPNDTGGELGEGPQQMALDS